MKTYFLDYYAKHHTGGKEYKKDECEIFSEILKSTAEFNRKIFDRTAKYEETFCIMQEGQLEKWLRRDFLIGATVGVTICGTSYVIKKIVDKRREK